MLVIRPLVPSSVVRAVRLVCKADCCEPQWLPSMGAIDSSCFSLFLAVSQHLHFAGLDGVKKWEVCVVL